MKKITKRKTLIILSTGLFVIAISQIVGHFVSLNDFTKGSLLGIGIGLLVTSLTIGNFKKTIV